MSRTTTMTVRIGETLGDYVSTQVGSQGTYDNVSEYVRDLIRKDKEKHEAIAFERLKDELKFAFAAPDSSYVSVSVNDIINRNKQRNG